jgi:hypothetical protein
MISESRFQSEKWLRGGFRGWAASGGRIFTPRRLRSLMNIFFSRAERQMLPTAARQEAKGLGKFHHLWAEIIRSLALILYDGEVTCH